MKVKGKVAWVTGGISGIGEAVAKALYNEGAKLLLTDINEERGNEFIKQFGDDAIFAKANIADYNALKDAAALAVQKWGHMDILFNAAGRGCPGVVLSDDPAKIEDAIATWNRAIPELLGGSYYTTMIAANYMWKNEPDPETEERGAVILLGSMASDKVFLQFSKENIEASGTMSAMPYAAAKAGVLGLTRDFAVLLSPWGIRVNCIKPGYILTPMQAPISADGKHGKNDAKHLPMMIFPKFGGKAEYISTMAMEIIHNPFINRTDIAVDAGIIG